LYAVLYGVQRSGSRMSGWAGTARVRGIVGVALIALLSLAGTAHAEQQTFRYGPIPIGPYSVNERDLAYDIPKPNVDGFVTSMEAHLVDANGSPVPIQRVMLHHLIFSNAGS